MNPDDCSCDLNRRAFLALAAVALAGCQNAGSEKTAEDGSRPKRVVDAGPASQFSADRVYDQFKADGFFIVRLNGKLFALSSRCTHRNCKLNAELDSTFSCPCHGSSFSPVGKVMEGPAVTDLPVFATSISPEGHLIVTLNA